MLKRFFVFMFCVLICGIARAQAPFDLRCEHQVDPIAIDAETPRFSCKNEVDRQSAYRILVASSLETLATDVGDLWDSGKVDSGEQLFVPYTGAALSSQQRAFWKVRTWDGNDAPTPWSDPSHFTMGFLSPDDWQAHWIAGRESGDGETVMPIFRTVFSLDNRKVSRATWHVCGLGHFEASINGERVGNHELDPGWTDYEETCLYVSFDVTDQLQPGNNALGVMLGNGMYNVPGGRYTKFTGTFGEPKLIAELHIVYDDGTTQTVPTDGSWQTDAGPIVFSCVYGGEDYDARREQGGWNRTDFDASGWSDVRVVDGPGGQLRAQTMPPITVKEQLRAVTITKEPDGSYCADLGRNLSMMPRITVKGERGQTVRVEVAERLGQRWEGHSYTYTLRGGGEETFRPRFTYFGFQYVYVFGVTTEKGPDGSLPVLVDVGGDYITSSAKEVGAFECSNESLNDVDAMIARSVESNLQSVLTDCPHREKLGWLEVSHLMGPSILYRYDAWGLYRKIVRDTTESQLENGHVPDIAPEYTRFSGGFFESPEWGSACVLNTWMLYKWYGDTQILEQQYDTMRRYTEYLASIRDGKNLVKAGLGDWYDWSPEQGHVGNSQHTPGELTATAMLYEDARIVAKTAEILGKPDEAQRFETLSGHVRGAFMKAYYDPTTHQVATGSQASLAVALFFGLVPEEDRDAVFENLLAALQKIDYRPTVGEVTFRYLIQTLAEAGRSDVVYRIIDRPTKPGYIWMMNEFGLQTLSERWDRPGSSLNHCMFGHAQEWFQGYILGIRQAADSLGFEHIVIAPEPVGDLTSASGYYDSPRGRIAVNWMKSAGSFTLDVEIPGNTRATVIMPGVVDAPVNTESVRFVRNENGRAEFEVSARSHSLTCAIR